MDGPCEELTTAPADYFPAAGGRYRVEPGLFRFGRDFGNGASDGHIFQLDRRFQHDRRAKLAARAERLGKYYRTDRLGPEVADTVTSFIAVRLAADHPHLFRVRREGHRAVLHCGLTDDSLALGHGMLQSDGGASVSPPYIDALDALACQVQEDFAVISTDSAGHWLSAIHLCFPNHWAAEDKIGRGFAAIHEPVAGIEPVKRQADSLVRLMVAAEHGMVRFAWGVTRDDRLNHHPHDPPEQPDGPFDFLEPRAFLRVERQTVWGFPRVGAALFTIRTYLTDCRDLTAEQQIELADAVDSMTPASLAYKGLASWKDGLVTWLRRLPGSGR